MEKTLKVLPPRMPNYVQLDFETSDTPPSYDIVNFTKQEAEEYGKLLHKTFVEHWEKRKKIEEEEETKL